MIFESISSALIYLVAILIVTVVLKSWFTKPGNIPPYPVKPYPILGHLPYLGKGDPREIMNEWKTKCGDIFSLKMGPHLVVVFNTFEILKETLVKQADIYSDRGPLFTAECGHMRDKGIIFTSGPVWKEQRSVTMGILRNFGMGKNVLAEKIQDEISAFLDELGNLKGEPTNIRILTNASVANVICAIIVGKRFDYHDPYFTDFLDSFNELVRLDSGTSLVNWFHWLRFLPGDYFHAKKLLRYVKRVIDYFSDRFIGESKEIYDEENLESFIHAYIKEQNKRERRGENTTMDEANLQVVICQLFIAGSETTSTTMLWFLLFLLHHPEVQKKIYQEIVDVVGTERTPSMHDRPKLNYLNAAIMEVQRRASILPFSVPHWVQTETQIQGYTIPKNTFIWPNLDAVLFDEKTWGDPMNFRPDRFLDDKGNLVVPEEFIPFSIGRRICLGESLAKMELFLYLASVLQRFQVFPEDPNALPTIKAKFGLAIATAPYKIKLVERRSF